MKFQVCIKQVPDISAPAGSGQRVMNAYDASALEAALVLREEVGGSIALVSIGPPSAKEALHRGLAMGADSATLLETEDTTQLDSLAFATLLARHFENQSYDVILCGKQAQDTDAGLTGPMLAALLELRYATNAVALGSQDGQLQVTRQADCGQQRARIATPCLVTCSNDMNTPRIPTLKGTMGARKKPLEVVPVSETIAATTTVEQSVPMPKRSQGTILTGETPAESVARLIEQLRDVEKVT